MLASTMTASIAMQIGPAMSLGGPLWGRVGGPPAPSILCVCLRCNHSVFMSTLVFSRVQAVSTHVRVNCVPPPFSDTPSHVVRSTISLSYRIRRICGRDMKLISDQVKNSATVCEERPGSLPAKLVLRSVWKVVQAACATTSLAEMQSYFPLSHDFQQYIRSQCKDTPKVLTSPTGLSPPRIFFMS